MDKVSLILLVYILLFNEHHCYFNYCDDCGVTRPNKGALTLAKQEDKCYPGHIQCAFDNPYILFFNETHPDIDTPTKRLKICVLHTVLNWHRYIQS